MFFLNFQKMPLLKLVVMTATPMTTMLLARAAILPVLQNSNVSCVPKNSYMPKISKFMFSRTLEPMCGFDHVKDVKGKQI